jgi:hypothetical protein
VRFKRRHRPTVFLIVATFVAMLLAHVASAQVKATAPEKMLPSDKAKKMRECAKLAEQRKVKMDDRSRFVNECVAAGAK